MATSVVAAASWTWPARRASRSRSAGPATKDGNPTTGRPPLTGQALVTQLGGHRGYGMAVMLDVLAGVLSGRAVHGGMLGVEPWRRWHGPVLPDDRRHAVHAAGPVQAHGWTRLIDQIHQSPKSRA